jgi:hypothetical protein
MFITVAAISFAVLAVIGLLLVALRTVNSAILSAFDTLWHISPALGAAFGVVLSLSVSLLLLIGGGRFWTHRHTVIAYWLARLMRPGAVAGPWELESDYPAPDATSRAVVVGTSGAVVAAAMLVLIVGSVAANTLDQTRGQGAQGAQGALLPTSSLYSSSTVQTVIATATPVATATSAPQPTATSGGKPFIGGPFSNFPAKFGPPIGHGAGDSDNFYADASQTIVIDVSPTSGTVTYVSVIGPDTWSDVETFTYCIQFLPDGATEYNSAGPNTDFHSNVGDLVVSNYGSGACVINMVR